MTPIPFFQVDAFAERPLTGNPAAVMPLDEWLDDDVLQAIAAENNLSETAFTIPSNRDDADFDLRWFTPGMEVDMCGHATLAAGHVLMAGQKVRFAARCGIMTVSRNADLLELEMAAAKLTQVDEPDLCVALGLPNLPIWLADESCCDDHAGSADPSHEPWVDGATVDDVCALAPRLARTYWTCDAPASTTPWRWARSRFLRMRRWTSPSALATRPSGDSTLASVSFSRKVSTTWISAPTGASPAVFAAPLSVW